MGDVSLCIMDGIFYLKKMGNGRYPGISITATRRPEYDDSSNSYSSRLGKLDVDLNSVKLTADTFPALPLKVDEGLWEKYKPDQIVNMDIHIIDVNGASIGYLTETKTPVKSNGNGIDINGNRRALLEDVEIETLNNSGRCVIGSEMNSVYQGVKGNVNLKRSDIHPLNKKSDVFPMIKFIEYVGY